LEAALDLSFDRLRMMMMMISSAEFISNLMKSVEITAKMSFTPSSEIQLSLHMFSQNSSLFNGIISRTRMPNFTQIGTRMC